MTRLPKTPRYSRVSLGANGDVGRRNVCNISFARTDLHAPAAASATALASVITLTTSGTTSQTITSVPDVPRNITVTLAGTTASIGAGNIVLTGTDWAGGPITENIAVTAATGGLLSGNKAFRTLTSLSYPATTGAGVTATVGYGSKLGLNLPNLSTGVVRVWAKPAAGQESNTETLIAPTASALDPTVVSNNTITVNGTMNSVIEYVAYVLNYNWVIHPAVASNLNQFGLK
jgi:hypothetical protein